jgi:hypothetical protein
MTTVLPSCFAAANRRAQKASACSESIEVPYFSHVHMVRFFLTVRVFIAIVLS